MIHQTNNSIAKTEAIAIDALSKLKDELDDLEMELIRDQLKND